MYFYVENEPFNKYWLLWEYLKETPFNNNVLYRINVSSIASWDIVSEQYHYFPNCNSYLTV